MRLEVVVMEIKGLSIIGSGLLSWRIPRPVCLYVALYGV